MPDSQKSKEIEKTKIVIDFDEAMKYPPIAVSTKKLRKKKERKMSKKLNLDRMKSVLRTHHGGPGPHKDGSSQDVHGKKSSGGGSRRRGGKKQAGKYPAKMVKGNRVLHKWDPIREKVEGGDYGDKLAYGFVIGDDVFGKYNEGGESEVGILRGYYDDHFYVDLDAGLTEFYKTKIEKAS